MMKYKRFEIACFGLTKAFLRVAGRIYAIALKRIIYYSQSPIHFLPVSMWVNVKDVLYVEWVPAGTLVKALVGFFSLLSLCILLVTIAVGVAIQHPFLIVVLASPLAFVLFVFWNYRGIRIKVTTESLLIYYGFFNHKHILIGDIVSCEPTKASFRRYYGIGVRYGTDGSWAYTTSLGDAVKIILRKGKPFVFSSNNPEKICNVINQMKNVS